VVLVDLPDRPGVRRILAVLAVGEAGGTQDVARPDSPEEILKRRYASGEIDRAEYDRRLADLRK